jgi:Helicase HerA, central domain
MTDVALPAARSRRWWVRGITAFPELPHGDSEQGEWLSQQVHAALAVEVGSLTVGDVLLIRARFGKGRIDGTIVLRSGASAPDAGPLGAVAGCASWQELTIEPELIGLTEYAPASRARVGLAAGVRARWNLGDGFWTRSVEELAHGAGCTEVVALIEKPAVLTPAALVAAERRWRRMRDAGRAVGPDESPSQRIAGTDAYSARLFLAGDAAGIRAFQQLWLLDTGTDLVDRRALPAAVTGHPGSLEAQIQLLLAGALTAQQAVRLLPVPLLDAHSAIGAERHVYRAHQHASAASEARDILLGATDGGTVTGMAAHTVNQHLLVLGDTGYGKTTTIMGLLHQAWKRFGIPSLVIDPVKQDFADLLVASSGGGTERPVRHLALGTVPINPLVVPHGVEPAVFAAFMSEAFNATSDLGESYPLGAAVAQAAFDRLYQETSTPAFADLMAAFMAETHRSDMSGENGRNVRASLSARLRAITGGAAGEAFAGGPGAGIDWDRLAQEPTVLTFDQALPASTLATMYAFLIAAHGAWRRANPTSGRHLLILEEAEMVFSHDNEPADRMLTQLLATMRATGQGYVAISQRPDQLSVLASSLFPNVISHRMLHTQELALLGALGATSEDMSSLDVGEAILRVGAGRARGTRVRTLTVPGGSYRPRPLGHKAPNRRAEEFVTPSSARRPWCDNCPKPCNGSSWLRFTPQATDAARRATGLEQQIVNAMGAAMRAAQSERAPRGTGAQFYCVAAAAVTALNSATSAEAARATRGVRSAVDRVIAAAETRDRSSV